LAHLQLRRTGKNISDAGRQAASRKIKASHATHPRTGENHPTYGYDIVRGSWVTDEECQLELEHYVDLDMTIAMMAEAMGVNPRIITKRLHKWGLQRGHRSGTRCSWYRGGWRKGRGPDWLETRQRILERDGFICTNCKLTQEEAGALGHPLSIHHLIPWEESFDNSDENLLTLCQSCHMKREWKDGRWRKKPPSPNQD
jgi:5-methylcytosine-specific restriction endonuclease McrA